MADVAAGEDKLPLIQHGLMYMWNAEAAKARPGSKIVLEAAPLKAAGGLGQSSYPTMRTQLSTRPRLIGSADTRSSAFSARSRI